MVARGDRPLDVGLGQGPAIDEYQSFPERDLLPRQSDHALDVRLGGRCRRLQDDDVSALRSSGWKDIAVAITISPRQHVPQSLRVETRIGHAVDEDAFAILQVRRHARAIDLIGDQEGTQRHVEDHHHEHRLDHGPKQRPRRARGRIRRLAVRCARAGGGRVIVRPGTGHEWGVRGVVVHLGRFHDWWVLRDIAVPGEVPVYG